VGRTDITSVTSIMVKMRESESEEEYNDRYFVFVIQNNRIRSFVTERPYEYDAYDLDEVDDNSKNIDEIIEAFVDEQQPQELVGISYSDIQLNRASGK
jgi:hypothetical protein